MAHWNGRVPRQNATGSKDRLGRIRKQGDHYLRWLLVAGAIAVVRHAKRGGPKRNPTAVPPWLAELIARKPTEVSAVALTNKIARTAWALLARGGAYNGTVHRPAATA